MQMSANEARASPRATGSRFACYEWQYFFTQEKRHEIGYFEIVTSDMHIFAIIIHCSHDLFSH